MRISSPTLTSITFIGTLLQWLEFASFAYLASVITMLYYPQGLHATATIGHIAFLSTAFLAPVIGATLFGYVGDYYGRKVSLSVAIFMMGIASLTISFLPTFHQAGIVASILLMLCRVIQGVALAGEFNGASIFLMEHSSKKHQHLACSIPAVAAGAGLLLGFFYADAIKHTGVINWAWRLPFLLSAASCIIFSYLRLSTKETPSFKKAVQQSRLTRTPLAQVISQHKIAVIEAIILSAFIITYIAVCGIYFFQYLVVHTNLPYGDVIFLTVVGNLSLLGLLPIFGYIADLIGKQTLLSISLIGAAICAPMMFMLASSQSLIILGFCELFYAIFAASAIAPLLGTLGRLFPAPVRYTGLSFSWSISFAIFGGSTPLMLSYAHSHHLAALPPMYASVTAIIALAVMLSPKPQSLSNRLYTGHNHTFR